MSIWSLWKWRTIPPYEKIMVHSPTISWKLPIYIWLLHYLFMFRSKCWSWHKWPTPCHSFHCFRCIFSLRSFGAQSKSRAVLASARRRVGMRLAAKIDVASSKVTWILMGFNHGFTIGVGKSTIQRWFPRQNFHSWRYRLGYWRVEN